MSVRAEMAMITGSGSGLEGEIQCAFEADGEPFME